MPNCNNIRIIVLFVFVFCAKLTIAQDSLNSNIVESKSLQLYNEKKYKELIKFVDAAIKQNFDYYYLRMRIGIAYYERKNYMLAEKHFSKALKFDSNDEVAKEYLYYCYIYNERYTEARKVGGTFSPELAKKIGIDKQASLGFVQLEGGAKLPNKKYYLTTHLDTLSNAMPPNDPVDSVYYPSDTTIYSNAKYFQFAFNHYVKNKIAVFHALTFFNQSSSHSRNGKYLFDKDTTDMGGNPVHIHLETNSFNRDNDNVTQYMYYLKMNIPLKNNWSVSPAFHLVNKTDVHQSDSSIVTFNHGNFQYLGIREYNVSTNKSNYFLGSIDVSKYFSRLQFSFGNSFSNIDGLKRYQNNLSLNYFVFGNNHLMLGIDGYYLLNIDSAFSRKTMAVALTYRPISKLSFSANYLFSSKDDENSPIANNVVLSNGYLINNSGDKTRSSFSASATITIGKHVDFYLLYSNEQKVAVYPARMDTEIKETTNVNYYYNNYFAGIRIYNFTKIRKQKPIIQ